MARIVWTSHQRQELARLCAEIDVLCVVTQLCSKRLGANT